MDEVLLAVEPSDPLLARLVAFCDQHELHASISRFCQRHVEAFDALDQGEGQELAHAVYELFHRFEELFADAVGAFLDREGLSPERFFAHCEGLQASAASGGDRAAADLLRLLLGAALDLDVFCALMRREALETLAAREDAADMGL